MQPELLFLAQISTKSFGGWGFAPDPTVGAYSAPPDPLAVFRGPTSKGKERGEGEGREEGEGKEGEGRAPIEMMAPQSKILNTPLITAKSYLPDSIL